MVIGLLDTGLYLTKCLLPAQPAPALQSNDTAPVVQPEYSAPVRVLPIVLNSIPLVVGGVILFKTKSIANWIAEKLE